MTLCRSLVEEPYYNFGNRGVYDIRHPYGMHVTVDQYIKGYQCYRANTE